MSACWPPPLVGTPPAPPVGVESAGAMERSLVAVSPTSLPNLRIASASGAPVKIGRETLFAPTGVVDKRVSRHQATLHPTATGIQVERVGSARMCIVRAAPNNAPDLPLLADGQRHDLFADGQRHDLSDGDVLELLCKSAATGHDEPVAAWRAAVAPPQEEEVASEPANKRARTEDKDEVIQRVPGDLAEFHSQARIRRASTDS